MATTGVDCIGLDWTIDMEAGLVKTPVDVSQYGPRDQSDIPGWRFSLALFCSVKTPADDSRYGPRDQSEVPPGVTTLVSAYG
jgi:hypothetical protein